MPASPRLLIGQVMHRRLRPVVNAFTYPVFFIQLPVADLAAANGPLFSVDRNNLLSFHQKDHGPRDGSPLLPWIRSQLRRHGLPDDGEVILQCFPRVFGFVFNPVSFWFCRNRDGQLIAVLERCYARGAYKTPAAGAYDVRYLYATSTVLDSYGRRFLRGRRRG